MTNKERYQRTFMKLHASDRIEEVKTMRQTKRMYMKRYIPVLAAMVLSFSVATAVYAADVGGIQRIVQIWIHGDQTNAVLEIDEGHYTMTYKDTDGNSHTVSGGGVAFDPDGNDRPVSEEELMEQINAPEVDYREDGSVIVYYHNQSIDITDKFEDSVCRIKIVENRDTLYMTVKYNKGYATSSHGYVNPNHFNTSE